jgi:hypothetical protein
MEGAQVQFLLAFLNLIALTAIFVLLLGKITLMVLINQR